MEAAGLLRPLALATRAPATWRSGRCHGTEKREGKKCARSNDEHVQVVKKSYRDADANSFGGGGWEDEREIDVL